LVITNLITKEPTLEDTKDLITKEPTLEDTKDLITKEPTLEDTKGWKTNSEYDIVSEEITFIYQSFDRLKLQWRGKAKQKHFFDFEKLTLL
jgi:hypothetical protein